MRCGIPISCAAFIRLNGNVSGAGHFVSVRLRGVTVERTKDNGKMGGSFMFCRNCGKEVAQGDKFCANCGVPINTPTTDKIPQSQDNGTANLGKRLNKIADFLLILASICFLIHFLTRCSAI